MNILPLSIRACLLASALAPFSAIAASDATPAIGQALVNESVAASGNTLWSARSGGYRPLSGLGLDSALSDPNVGAALVYQPNGSLSLFSSVFTPKAYERGSASVPWCAESSGLLRIGSLGQECLMQGTLQFELPGRVASAQTGVNFSGGNWDVTLSYGLTWLMNKLDMVGANAEPQLAELSSSAALPGAFNLLDAQTQGVAIGAQWRLTQASALQLNAALNQLRLHSSGYALPGLNVNEAQAGVGLAYGPFTGNVSGRVQRAYGPAVSGNAALWGGLDLGVSWRTPWRGELTVGARNLVTKGEQVLLPDPQAANTERSSTRTPYVRYKQDL